MKQRVFVTGVGGNIGKGVVPRLLDLGCDVVASDVNAPSAELRDLGVPYHQLDIQHGFGLDRAAEGADVFLHLPAWHGIHWQAKTEADFWRLNVDGTFWAFQAAKANQIKRFVFLSSQAWHGHYDKYGFTKRVGEELCEYNRQSHGVSYVSIRPADLTPWRDWVSHYGPRLLYGGVDREDVLAAIVRSVEYLAKKSDEATEKVIVDAMRPNAFTEADLEGWEADPLGACDRIFPGSRPLVEKYGLDIARKPHVIHSHETGGDTVGFAAQVHFGTFLAELARLDAEFGEDHVRSLRCPY